MTQQTSSFHPYPGWEGDLLQLLKGCPETHAIGPHVQARRSLENAFNEPNGLYCVTDCHGRVYDWDEARDTWIRRVG